MSFQLGSFDSDSISDFKAILTEWPALPVELHLDELPSGDGSLYYRARMTETEWVFNLELTGSDVADVLAKADAVSAALNPKLHGEQDFTPNAFDPWVWRGVLGGPVTWERDSIIWFSDRTCRLAGQATVVTPNPYGYSAGSPTVLSSSVEAVLPVGGNTSAFPIVEFRGVLNSAQAFTLNGIQVAGPLTASQTLVLDFENLDFYIKTTATGAKVRNVADRFTNFKRLEGTDSIALTAGVTAGTFTQATARVNSRRI
ncbi:minor tail protein [Microbacterium phage Kauala]|nr:minor tail protein [Microbacterium phage Kauala]